MYNLPQCYQLVNFTQTFKQVLMDSWMEGQKDLVGLLFLGLTALRDSISLYIGTSPRERKKEERNDRREKNCPNNPHPHLLQAQ